MFLEIIIAIIFGILAGTFTGLIPGIHVNLIAGILLINFFILNEYIQTLFLIIFIISMSITHTYISFIPSVIFGVPDSDTVMSILPSHRMVHEGKAYEAIYLSSLGSLSGTIFSILIIPILYLTLEKTYEIIKPFIPYFLILVVLSMIISEKEKMLRATTIVLLSGSFGYLILNSQLTNNPLLIIFSGLFGVAAIIESLKTKTSSLPKQSFERNFKINIQFLKAITLSGIISSICSISPGLGNAQAATIATIFFKKVTSEIFIVITSAINTINFMVSILTLYLIEKARNGAVLVISQVVGEITIQDITVYLFIAILTSLIAFKINNYLGKTIITKVENLNLNHINFFLLIFITIIVFVLTNIYGIIILLASTVLGLLCLNLKVRRIHLMSILIIPVILNFI